VTVDLHVIGREGPHTRQLVTTTVTNADGRTAAPLLAGDRIERGVYELTFHVAAYFRRLNVTLTDPPFLGEVVIRIGIADAVGLYHVPLLLSPYGYSTYRGS
jgi:5-hydroxyisourate hydrolase